MHHNQEWLVALKLALAFDYSLEFSMLMETANWCGKN